MLRPPRQLGGRSPQSPWFCLQLSAAVLLQAASSFLALAPPSLPTLPTGSTARGPPKMRPSPRSMSHSQSLPALPRFLPPPPQIFCPRPKPHVSPLVGLLASAQTWSVVIYSAWSNVHEPESFPSQQSLMVPPVGVSHVGSSKECGTQVVWCDCRDVQMRSTCLSVAEASWETCGQRHSCLKDQTGVNSSFFSPLHR